MQVDVVKTGPLDHGPAKIIFAEPDRPAVQPDAAPVSGLAFDALLQTLRVAHGGKALRHHLARETLVFEATPADPRQHRLATLGKEARSEAVKGDPGRLEKYRANAKHTPAQRSGDHALSNRTDRTPDPLRSPASRRCHTSSSASTATGPGADDTAAFNKLAGTAKILFADSCICKEDLCSTRSHEGAGQRDLQRSSLQYPNGPLVGRGAQRAASMPVRAASPQTTDRGGSIARQIGRVLASERGSGPANVKAPAAPAAGSHGSAASRADGNPGKGGDAARASRQQHFQDTGRSNTPARSDFDRIIRSFRLQTGRHRSTARIQLHPPQLGRMRVEARLSDTRLELFIQTETPRAKELIRERLVDLQQSLERHGVQIGRVQVDDSLTGSSSGDTGDTGQTHDGEPDRSYGKGQSDGSKHTGSRVSDDKTPVKHTTDADSFVVSDTVVDIRI